MIARNRTANQTTSGDTLKVPQFVLPAKSKVTSPRLRRVAKLRTKIEALKRQLAQVLGVAAE